MGAIELEPGQCVVSLPEGGPFFFAVQGTSRLAGKTGGGPSPSAWPSPGSAVSHLGAHPGSVDPRS